LNTKPKWGDEDPFIGSYRCWEGAEPIEERVRENILALPSILDDIIAAEGCIISEFSHINNKGKRYKKLKSEGELKRKPTTSGRKSTLVLRPYHPDLQPAIDSLTAGTLLTAATDIVESASLEFDEYEVQEGGEDPYNDS
jgi:hypothetical protein